MSFNINELKAQLTFGGMRSSHFKVQIQNPANSIADIKVPFLVKAAQVPESTLGTIPVYYFGRPIKLAGDRQFQPWTVTVINDEDFLIRNAMEQWMSAINTHQGNQSTFANGSPLNYKSTAEITQLSKTGVPVRVYRFNGLFPVNISQMDVAWDQENTIQEYQISFEYDFWDVSGGITGTAGTDR